ncbi:endolytic transglycosylase MltG [Neomegalonema perideroedes]|uniref:endolytic transglycosylase MltG n=1 Tax=Neomegalonema perideroedes TaxID=217219 RepID=UPI00036AF80B|nr:endolytic transglycosylase MltG [Neomegalonema perideroedes]
MRFLAKLFGLLLFGAAAGLVLALLVRDRLTAPGPLTAETIVEIPRGASAAAIAERLGAAGAISDPLLFRLSARLSDEGGALKAGEYSFPPGASLQEVFQKIARGEVVQRRVTLAEGVSSLSFRALLDQAEGLEGETPAELPEGALAPDTYFYLKGETRAALVARMAQAQSRILDELWTDRAPNLPFSTKEEALVLASIIEKETGVAAERERVAGVFVNRLRQGMRLQSDPTVIYGVVKGADLGRGLRRSELDAPTPYNTYAVAGLPPTPIAHPGRASIAAALNPMETKDLYFVADGSGGHAFAETLEQHNANVRRWREIERARAAGPVAAPAAPAPSETGAEP